MENPVKLIWVSGSELSRIIGYDHKTMDYIIKHAYEKDGKVWAYTYREYAPSFHTNWKVKDADESVFSEYRDLVVNLVTPVEGAKLRKAGIL